MPIDGRQKNRNWHLVDAEGNLWSNMRDAVAVAVLMDIRDELQSLNRLLNCSRFVGIPDELREIRMALQGLRRDLKSEKKK